MQSFVAALDQYAEMDQNARAQAGLEYIPDDMGHPFPHFAPGFVNSNMPGGSPALAHTHPGMHPQGSIPTAGRPTPTPPPIPMRPGGPGMPPQRMANNGAPLAGSGELPPLPSLGIPPGMIMSQSPSLTHPMPPGQPPNGQVGTKRKLQPPDQGPDVGGPSAAPGGSQPPRAGVGNNPNPHGRVKPPPAVARKKAKTNTNAPAG